MRCNRLEVCALTPRLSRPTEAGRRKHLFAASLRRQWSTDHYGETNCDELLPSCAADRCPTAEGENPASGRDGRRRQPVHVGRQRGLARQGARRRVPVGVFEPGWEHRHVERNQDPEAEQSIACDSVTRAGLGLLIDSALTFGVKRLWAEFFLSAAMAGSSKRDADCGRSLSLQW